MLAGNIRRAQKSLDAGASLHLHGDTAAERELISNERADLWHQAIQAPSDRSIRWLVAQEPSFLNEEFTDITHLLDVMEKGAEDTLAWASETILPKVAACQPWHVVDLRALWRAALARKDAVGVAWMLNEDLMPQMIPDEDNQPAMWQAMKLTSSWQTQPQLLADRLVLLAAHGHRADAPKDASETSALEVWIERYGEWSEKGRGTPIGARYEDAGPLIWDALVSAGGDPEALDKSGHPMWKAIADTPLGQRYQAQRRAEATPALDTTQARRRLRS